MAISIKDVANLAGVSHQTVSRVINNSPYVKPDTRRKVLEAIEKLQYYPNRSARNLNRTIVNAVGLSIPFPSDQAAGNPFVAEMIGAIGNVCNLNGVCLNVISFDEKENDMELLIRFYKERTISGLLLTWPGMDEKSVVQLKYHDIPCVVIGRPDADYGIHYVDVDHVRIGYECTRHLLGLGHRRIALLNGRASTAAGKDLYAGYAKALGELRIPADPDLIAHTGLAEEDGEARLPAWLDRQATAVFCANDALALGTIKAAQDRGLSIPDDLSVVAGTSSRWNAFIRPALTSVEIDYRYQGKMAIELLFDEIFNGRRETARIAVPAELVVRHSCGRPG